MKLRTLTGFLAFPVVLLVTGVIAWWWLLHTEAGARWVFEKAIAAIHGSLAVNKVSGDLNSGLRLEGIRFEESGVIADVEVLKIAFNVDLIPVSVEITTLHADKILLQTTLEPEKPSKQENDPFAFDMPFPLVFRDLKLSAIEYSDGSGGDPIVIESIEAAGSVHDTLVLDRLSVSHPDIRLDLSGRLALASPHALAVKFQSQGSLTLEGSIDGSLDSAELVLDVADPQAHVAGTLGQLLSTPVWDLRANSPSLQLPPSSQDPAATLTEVQAHTSGEWPQLNLDLAANLDIPGFEPSQFTVSGSGTSHDFTAQKLTLQGPEFSLDGAGTLSWEDTLRLALDANVARLDLRTWIPEWPENQPVNGQFAVSWAGEDLAINDFYLVVSGTPFTASGYGIVAPGTGVVDAALNWENFSWPIGSTSPAIASKSGSLKIGGRPEKWEMDGILDLQSGDYPPGRLQLSGAGTDESLNIVVQEGQILGGTISGNLFWKWTGNQPFEAEMLAQRVNITPLFPDYPGVLSARLALEGEVEPLRLAVDIQQLDGTIQELPFNGKGGLRIEQGRLIAKQLHLASGASSLTIDGSLYEPGGITFAADIDSLARVSEDFQGSLSARGNVSLNPASPSLSVSLSGQDLVLGSVRIDRIEAQKPSGSGFEGGSGIVLSGLAIGQQKVETLSIGIGGEKPFERIAVNARMKGTDIVLDLAGSVNDWADPVGSGWRGELTGLRIDHRDEFFLALEQPAALEWTPGHFSLEQACHSGTEDSRLCMTSSWRDQGELNISASLAAIPVSLMGILVDTEFRLSHILNGTLDWSQSAMDGNRGSARFEISPGRITSNDDDELILDTGPGQFGFELAGGTLQKGNLDLSIPGTGEIDIDFNIPDLSLGSYSPIGGNVRVDIHDLGSLGPIVPLFDSLKGAVNIDVRLSGILADPAFTGQASMTNGEFAIAASGSTFSEINLSGNVSDMDRSDLKGTFRAGEGSGTITTIIYFEDLLSPVIELTLKGDSLTIVDVPELNITANPDFTLNWKNSSLEIDGRLLIPKARLAPTIIPRESAGQSADVVIVAGELPESESGSQRSKPLSIRGTLEVELGEQAEIDLKMAKVNVVGSTRFTWQDELLPLANGNFDIRGEIQAYGQLLKITRGRISFPDIPADNPHLDIRAERDIFGNSQVQKAGLMVAGTVKRPLIEPYTVPMTNKDRARTLLVTGSDFNYEQGVGAIAVGFYVLPRLYISYGIGVFEEGNIISVRYDLGKRFGVRVTSGQRDTGADLNYTIER